MPGLADWPITPKCWKPDRPRVSKGCRLPSLLPWIQELWAHEPRPTRSAWQNLLEYELLPRLADARLAA